MKILRQMKNNFIVYFGDNDCLVIRFRLGLVILSYFVKRKSEIQRTYNELAKKINFFLQYRLVNIYRVSRRWLAMLVNCAQGQIPIL